MSEATAARFSCDQCGRTYGWKVELAGRRVKCKCGHVMTVPASLASAPDDLYDLAPTDDGGDGFSRLRAEVSGPPPAAQPAVGINLGIPLQYQQGPTQRELERRSSAALMDMKRDVYAPLSLLILGFVIYVGYYAFRYEMGGFGVAMTTLGLGILTAFKALLLIGFALVMAGPLGVSFGGIWTAVLKLAAIAVFADGVGTWVDAGVAHVSGGAGGAFSGVMSFPVVLAIYWMLLIYLFSMDPGDSWLVVILLAVFDMIVRTVLVLVLLRFVLGLGGVSPAALPVGALGGTSSPAIASDATAEYVRELKEQKALREAREFIAGGRQLALSKPTEAWYEAGCRNVWFEVSWDINGKITPESVIVELPRDKLKDKEKRDRCYAILREYYEEHNLAYDPDDLIDTGESHIIFSIN